MHCCVVIHWQRLILDNEFPFAVFACQLHDTGYDALYVGAVNCLRHIFVRKLTEKNKKKKHTENSHAIGYFVIHPDFAIRSTLIFDGDATRRNVRYSEVTLYLVPFAEK